MFLSLDGIDGVGKSTQLKVLVEKFQHLGREVITCREPGSTQLGLARRLLEEALAIREEDALKTAEAAKHIIEFLVGMKAEGWITTRKALEIAYKFAGEIIDVEALMTELEETPADTTDPADGDSEPASSARSGD